MGANGGFAEFNLCRIFKRCKGLKIFTVEFKDGLMVTPPVSYSGMLNGNLVDSNIIFEEFILKLSIIELVLFDNFQYSYRNRFFAITFIYEFIQQWYSFRYTSSRSAGTKCSELGNCNYHLLLSSFTTYSL